MSAELQRFWDGLGAVFVTVPQPEGAIAALLHAHDVVVVRPDRIVYAVAATAVDLLNRREVTTAIPGRLEERTT